MQLTRTRLPLRIKPEDNQKLRNELRKNYSFLIDHVKDSLIREKLRIIKAERYMETQGEIYFSEEGEFFYFFIPKEKNFIEAGCLLPEEEGMSAFKEFRDLIKNILLPGLAGSEPHWMIYKATNANFNSLKGEAKHIEASAKDLEASDILRNEEIRAILRDINSAPTCSLNKLVENKNADEITDCVEKLIDNGFVNREFVVFCKNNNVQISRVNDLSIIQEASSRGIKCPFCERLFSDERIDQELKSTDFGKKMIKPNFWLVLLTLQALSRIGIDTSDILTKEEKDFRIFDILANQNHHLILLEVKDSPARLDEIFLFQSRISFYKPDIAIFITTTGLKPEAKLYLSKDQKVPLFIIEGIDDLEENLRQIFKIKKADYLSDVFSYFQPSTQLDIERIFSEYFIDNELESTYKELNEDEDTGVVSAQPSMISPSQTLSEELDIDIDIDIKRGKRKTEAPEAAEEETQLIEEVIPNGNTGYISMEEETEKTEEKPEEIDDETQTEDLSLSVGEKELEIDEITGRIKDTMPVEREQTDLLGTGEEFILEEQYASNFRTEDVQPSAVSAEEKFSDETREALSRKIIDELSSFGFSGRSAQIEKLISELCNIEVYSSSLVSEDGLNMIDCMKDEANSEMIAAISTEICNNVKNAFKDVDFPSPEYIYIGASKANLYINSFQPYLLTVLESLKGNLAEEEPAQLPGEMELRDVIMKKVLNDLSTIEGISGNIVASRDGLSIDFTFNDNDVDIDLLSSICSQIINDNEKYFNKLDRGDLKQLTIRTEKTLYSLILLAKDGVLISLLEPDISKEIWKTRLLNSAVMITSVFQ